MHHHLTTLKLCFMILSTRQGGLYRVKISNSPTKPIHSDGLGAGETVVAFIGKM